MLAVNGLRVDGSVTRTYKHEFRIMGPLIDNDFPNEIHPDEPTVPTDEQIQYLSNIPKLKGSEYNCDGTTETTF